MSAREAQSIWLRGFDALRRRAGAFGQREHSGELDDFGFDPETLRVARRLLALARVPWWRSSTHGQDALHTLLAPAPHDDRPALIAATASVLHEKRTAQEAPVAWDSHVAAPGASRDAHPARAEPAAHAGQFGAASHNAPASHAEAAAPAGPGARSSHATPAEQTARALPAAGPPMFVSQPEAPVWSGLLIAERVAHVQERAGVDARFARPRFLVAQHLSAQPFAQPLLARLGGVGACRANLERLLDAGHAVVVSASARSAARGANPELCVETLARVALAHGSPLVPVSVEMEGLVRGLRMMPAARTALALDPLGLLPLRWRVAFCAPLETRGESGEPGEPGAPDTASRVDAAVARLGEALRAALAPHAF